MKNTKKDWNLVMFSEITMDDFRKEAIDNRQMIQTVHNGQSCLPIYREVLESGDSCIVLGDLHEAFIPLILDNTMRFYKIDRDGGVEYTVSNTGKDILHFFEARI